jgi:hypothetical protein
LLKFYTTNRVLMCVGLLSDAVTGRRREYGLHCDFVSLSGPLHEGKEVSAY